MENKTQQSKQLIAAREARKEQSYEDATRYYDMVKLDDPDCVEARFYHPFCKMMDSTNGTLYNNYLSFESAMTTPVKKMIASDLAQAENKELLKDMVEDIICTPKVVRTALNAISTENVTYSSEKAHAKKICGNMLIQIGDDLNKIYSLNKDLMLEIAVPAWKAGLETLPTKDQREMYAAKIQKYDPTYTLPKGCLGK